MRNSLVVLLLGALCLMSAKAGEPAEPKHVLERLNDVEMALMATRPELSEVRIFTWKGVALDGKITFRDGKNDKPMDLGVRAAAKNLLPKGKELDPRAISGTIVIAINKSTGTQARSASAASAFSSA